MQPTLERIRPWALEGLVAVLAVAAIAETFLEGKIANRPAVAATALLWTLPFAAIRRYPFWAPLAVCLGLALLALVAGKDMDNLTLPFIAAIAVSVSFGFLRERRQAVAGWSAIMAAAAFVGYRTSSGISGFFWTLLIFTLAWFFGVALGSRTEQARELQKRVVEAERERLLAEERAMREERARIARELHDVVAHSVSVMVVQASGVRRLLKGDQEREREALLSVEQTGREALAEMRRMLGVMRSGHEPPAALAPQPGLEHLDRLIAQVEEAGIDVTLRVEGERPELTPGVDLSAYRIVQEGLTNALKHANGAHVEVLVRYIDSTVDLQISDDGPGTDFADGLAQGLVGMRERVALYGGTIEAGPREGGGFLLHAELPVQARR